MRRFLNPRSCSMRLRTAVLFFDTPGPYGKRFLSTPTKTRRGQYRGVRKNKKGGCGSLSEDVKQFGDFGPLNPPWVEWLMGWPIGWTDLEQLETDKFQQFLRAHGCC